MPECHRCEHNQTGSAACLKCRGPAETNHKGRTFLSIDAGDEPQTIGEVEACAAVRYRQETIEAESSDHIDVANLREALRTVFDLSPENFAMVRAFFHGATMADVGRDMGMTRATISARVKKLVKRHPAFAFLRLACDDGTDSGKDGVSDDRNWSAQGPKGKTPGMPVSGRLTRGQGHVCPNVKGGHAV